MLLTFDAYTKQVYEAVETAKFGEAGLFLTKPSPAQLRDFCKQVYIGLESPKDRFVFESFFELDNSRPVNSQFDMFDVDKLRPVQKFILGKTSKPNPQVVELLAILTSFSPRPFSDFRSNTILNKEDLNQVKRVEQLVVPDNLLGKETMEFNSSKEAGNIVGKKKYNRFFVPFLLVVILFLGSGLIYYLQKSSLDCMQWNGEAYVYVDCAQRNLAFVDGRGVIPKDEVLLVTFKKVQVSKNTLFFKNGKALIWYGKNVEGEYEYFSTSGEHPETGKYLKPITKYHLNKYLKDIN